MSTAAEATDPKSTDPKSANSNKPQGGGYDVARPLGKCHVTGEPIAVGEKFMAALARNAAGL